MKMGKTLLTASALGIALVGATAPAATAGTMSTQAKHTASIACSSPKNAKANYSWGDGITNVTVYFNNHCSHKVSAGIVLEDTTGGGALSVECMTTNGGTSGKKKFHIGVDHTVKRIQKGCSL
ncbi:hypothetical protein ATK36_1647 [Amycolatopsis sulphurea]|uniref:Uncharacterized protein n=1 Tax=Amycolatopsis sulphurea TaxID=76022 RepID=A0A2A9F759_9PSEU|nr:hypothetical protein [Amycolatopsis sulphurea]PFG46656.1 hypothetical protein ATK36_1647 [Amycolatopsis sulphurea]